MAPKLDLSFLSLEAFGHAGRGLLEVSNMDGIKLSSTP
jgi:hypothetical protein